jgi:hypothetical protein
VHADGRKAEKRRRQVQEEKEEESLPLPSAKRGRATTHAADVSEVAIRRSCPRRLASFTYSVAAAAASSPSSQSARRSSPLRSASQTTTMTVSRVAAASSPQDLVLALPNALQGIIGNMLNVEELLGVQKKAAIEKKAFHLDKNLKYLCVTSLWQLENLFKQQPDNLLRQVRHLSLCLDLTEKEEDEEEEEEAHVNSVSHYMRSFARTLETLEICVGGPDKIAIAFIRTCMCGDDAKNELTYPKLHSLVVSFGKHRNEDEDFKWSSLKPHLFPLMNAAPALRHLSFLCHSTVNGEKDDLVLQLYRSLEYRKNDAANWLTCMRKLESLTLDWSGFMEATLEKGCDWPHLRFYRNVSHCRTCSPCDYASARFPVLQGLVVSGLRSHSIYSTYTLRKRTGV